MCRMLWGIAAVLVLLLAASPPALATLQFNSNIQVTGTGLGAVNTIVTAHDPPGDNREAGCVAWGGAADVIGSAACPAGFLAGAETDELAQNQTILASSIAGLTQFGDLALVFNISEIGTDLSVDLANMFLRIYNTDGTVLFTALLDPANVGDSFTQGTGTGLGGSGFVFTLSAAEAAAANLIGFNGAYRIGGGFLTVEGTTGDGNDTLHVISVTGPSVPEPGAVLLFGMALAAATFVMRRNRKSA